MSTPAPSGMVRSGAGTPLVLLHGVTGTSAMWRHVVPLLASAHDVVAATALGHRGGNPAQLRPARIAHVVDDAERLLDRLGFERAHLAGNSMGGWVALELARRDRALSVCALSPAGFWGVDRRAAGMLRKVAALTRRSRPILPLLTYSSRFRRDAMRDNAAHGDRVTRAEFLEAADDMIGCEVRDDLLATDEAMSELTARCPVTIAWSALDRIFPPAQHISLARKLIHGARFITLEGVGHVPMFDDPRLVADTILETTSGAQNRSSSSRAASPPA